MDPSGEEAVAMVQPTAIRAGATDPVSEFEDFVAVRSPRLLTTAYLLTHDHGRAEDLLQTSLAKLWLAWSLPAAAHDASGLGWVAVAGRVRVS
jgi:DNA-directed RNA polymerase specialized sigma24 family protein